MAIILYCRSGDPVVGRWEPLPRAFEPFDVTPSIGGNVLGTSCAFPAPDLQSAISSRIPGFFPQELALQNHNLGTKCVHYYFGHCFFAFSVGTARKHSYILKDRLSHEFILMLLIHVRCYRFFVNAIGLEHGWWYSCHQCGYWGLYFHLLCARPSGF